MRRVGWIAALFTSAGACAQNAWTSAGATHPGRVSHSFTAMADRRGLVLGGCAGGAPCKPPSASAMIHTPGSNTWAPAGNLTEARALHTANRLPDGRVLVAGGCTDTALPCTVLGSIVYQQAGNTFGNAAPMVVARTVHLAVAMDSGDMLVAGGVDSGSFLQRTAEISSVGSNTWVQVGSLAAGRESPRLSRLNGGQVVLAGGLDTNLTAVAAAERFQQGPTPLVQLSPASIDFGCQALRSISDFRALRVGNVGTAPLSVASVSLDGRHPGDFSFTSSCTSPVAPGDHCDIELRFRPLGVKDRNAVLRIADNAPNSRHQAALGGCGYVGAPNFWAPAGTMIQARFGQTLTALPDAPRAGQRQLYEGELTQGRARAVLLRSRRRCCAQALAARKSAGRGISRRFSPIVSTTSSRASRVVNDRKISA